LEKEIKYTNKLNAMLLKTINGIKSRKGTGGSGKKSRKGGANHTMILNNKAPKSEPFNLNRSLLGADKKESYLIGLERELELKKEAIEKRKLALELGNEANDLHSEVRKTI
jgi:hypothetical protein